MHPCSYVPAPPQKREKAQPFTQKFDYSKVRPRVDAGRSTASPSSSQATLRPFGLSAGARSSSHHSNPTSNTELNSKPRVTTTRTFSPLQIKSGRVGISGSKNYIHIKSRIDTGLSGSVTAKSKKLSLSADSGLKSRIKSCAMAEKQPGNSFKLTSSSLPDYSHVKSRTDSGQRFRSMSSDSQRSLSSISQAVG